MIIRPVLEDSETCLDYLIPCMNLAANVLSLDAFEPGVSY